MLFRFVVLLEFILLRFEYVVYCGLFCFDFGFVRLFIWYLCVVAFVISAAVFLFGLVYWLPYLFVFEIVFGVLSLGLV